MSQIFSPTRLILCLVVFLLAIRGASSQSPSAHSFGKSGRPAGDANAPPKTGLSGGRSASVTNPGTPSGTTPVGTITDTGFASRLGNAVGSQGYPSVALPPGVSNINHPGLQPMPSMQPLPTGMGFPLPSINYPGGTPAMHAPPQDPGKGHRHGFQGRGTSGIVYYGIPYYIPYYVYPQDASSGTAASPSSGYASSSPLDSQAGDSTSAVPAAKPLTLLAFKDHMVLIVINYWLEGDWLYYETAAGQRMSVPLDRLDQPLTQQLNRERNVPFVLESRR